MTAPGAKRPLRRATTGQEWAAPDGHARLREARCVACDALLGTELLDTSHINTVLVSGLVALGERDGMRAFGLRRAAKGHVKTPLRRGRSEIVRWLASDTQPEALERRDQPMLKSRETVAGPCFVYCPNCGVGQELPPG